LQQANSKPDETIRNAVHGIRAAYCRKRFFTTTGTATKRAPNRVNLIANIQLNARMPALGKSTSRTIATPHGPKKFAAAATTCCSGDMGASSDRAPRWITVKGRLTTSSATA